MNDRVRSALPSSDRWKLVVLLLIACAFRLVACEMRAGLGVSPRPDAREYVHVGQRLLEFHTLVSPLTWEAVAGEPSSLPSCLMPPIYTGIVAGTYWLFGVESYAATLALHLLNALATTAVVAVVFAVAFRLGGRRAAWLAAVVCAFNPVIAGYTGWIWDTPLFSLGVGVAVMYAWWLSKRPVTLWRGLPFGLYLGVLAQLNPALTTCYPLLVLWPVTKGGGWRFRSLLTGVTACIAGWLVAITPWTIRNYVQFDDLIYIRGGAGLELWLASCPEASDARGTVYWVQFPLKNDDVQQHLVDVGERAFVEECKTKAHKAISEDPWRFAYLAYLRGVCHWTGLTYPHSPPGTPVFPRRLVRGSITGFILLELILLVVGYVASRPLPTEIRWLIGMLVVFSITYCIFHVQVRFRMPVEPIFAIVIGVMWSRVRWHRPST